MKYENQIGCQYCGTALGAEKSDPTEKKVAMVVVHRGVCRNADKWPEGTQKMGVKELRAFLTELFETAEPEGYEVTLLADDQPVTTQAVNVDASQFTNAAGLLELEAKLRARVADMEGRNTYLLKMALGLAKVEQYYQREIDNVNQDTMCEGPFDGNEEDWEQFSSFVDKKGGLTVTLGFGRAVEMTAEERAENELLEADYLAEQEAEKTGSGLRNSIMVLLNQASREQESNTPDWLLADYLAVCLRTFETAVKQRDEYYGIAPVPGRPFQRVDSKYPGKSDNPVVVGEGEVSANYRETERRGDWLV